MKTRRLTKNISYGFSLAEISIGIIIIGLLIGAVVGSTVLIGQARLRAAITEMMQIQSRFTAFEAAYGYKPGDFPEASLFWGTSVCAASGVTGTDGANGDGDGAIKFAAVAASSGSHDALNESYLAWCHLGQANLGPITTPLGDITAIPTIGTNIPPSKMQNSGYIVAVDASEFGFTDSQHALIVGAPIATMLHPKASITPLDAYAIDKKLDNGSPDNGSIRVTAGNGKAVVDTVASPCVRGASGASKKYNLSGDGKGKKADCVLAMRID